MTDFPNLRSNFEHVIEHASLRDIETMLRVVGDQLGSRFHDASVLTYQAAQTLWEYRHGKRPQQPVDADAAHLGRCHDPACENPMHRRL